MGIPGIFLKLDLQVSKAAAIVGKYLVVNCKRMKRKRRSQAKSAKLGI